MGYQITVKALANKTESLQREHKSHVNKIKGLIPGMKGLMKQRRNVQELKSQLQTLTQLLDTAVNLHQTVTPLLPEDEKATQSECFSSIESYSSKFNNEVIQWQDEKECGSNPDEKDLFATNNDICHFQMDDGSRQQHSKKAPLHYIS